MIKEWRESRGLVARRTGIGSRGDYEIPESSISRLSTWIFVALVVTAFALALQLESDSKNGHGKVIVVGGP